MKWVRKHAAKPPPSRNGGAAAPDPAGSQGAAREGAGRSLALAAYRLAMRVLADRGLDRVGLLVALNHRIVRYLGSRPAEVGGHRMVLDPNDSLRLYGKGVYEPAETALLARSVRAGDVVLDIGANIGYFTLQLARHAGPQGRVVAFEPEPENVALLRRNVELNGYRTVEVVGAAVGDGPGTVTLHVAAENRGDHRLFGEADGRPTLEVPMVSIDAYLAEHGIERVDVVKIDVQGAEGLVFAGMRRLLAERPPRLLLVEFWPFGLRRCGQDPAALLDSLASVGHRIEEITRHGEEPEPLDPAELLARFASAREEDFTTLVLSAPR